MKHTVQETDKVIQTMATSVVPKGQQANKSCSATFISTFAYITHFSTGAHTFLFKVVLTYIIDLVVLSAAPEFRGRHSE